MGSGCLHVLLELLQVLLLLSKLLLQCQQLLLLAHADGVILVGLLTLGEGVASVMSDVSTCFQLKIAPNYGFPPGPPRNGAMPQGVCLCKGMVDLPKTSWSSGVSFGHCSLGGGESSDSRWL